MFAKTFSTDKSISIRPNTEPKLESLHKGYKLGLKDLGENGVFSRLNTPIELGTNHSYVMCIDSSGNITQGIAKTQTINELTLTSVQDCKLFEKVTRYLREKRAPKSLSKFSEQFKIENEQEDWPLVQQAYQANKIIRHTKNDSSSEQRTMFEMLNLISRTSISFLRKRITREQYDKYMKLVPQFILRRLRNLSKGDHFMIDKLFYNKSVEKSFSITREEFNNGVIERWPGILKLHEDYLKYMFGTSKLEKVYLLNLDKIVRREINESDLNFRFIDGDQKLYSQMIKFLRLQPNFGESLSREIPAHLNKLRKANIKSGFKLNSRYILRSNVFAKYFGFSSCEPGETKHKNSEIPKSRNVLPKAGDSRRPPIIKRLSNLKIPIKTRDFCGVFKIIDKESQKYDISEEFRDDLLKLACGFESLDYSKAIINKFLAYREEVQASC